MSAKGKRTCSVPECGRKHYGQGLCSTHYQRKRRSGLVESKKSVAWRLENNIERVPFSGCWLWLGYINHHGYGWLSVGDKGRQAHRASYELFVGPIPRDMYVLHRCDVRSCCNPAHLFLGNHQANMNDMVTKGRSLRGEKNAIARLTDETVRQIRAGGGSAAEWGKRLGVAKSTVKSVRAGITWRHVQ